MIKTTATQLAYGDLKESAHKWLPDTQEGLDYDPYGESSSYDPPANDGLEPPLKRLTMAPSTTDDLDRAHALMVYKGVPYTYPTLLP